MATFGDTTAGTDTFPTTNDRAILSRFTPATNGVVSQINCRFAAGGGSGSSMKGLIYADSGGAVGALLGVGSGVAVPAGGGDIASAGLSVPVTAGVYYWLGAVVSASGAIFQVDLSGGLVRSEQTEFMSYTSPPATWTQSGTSAAGVNAYATYAEGTPLPKGKPSHRPEGRMLRALDASAWFEKSFIGEWFWSQWHRAAEASPPVASPPEPLFFGTPF